MLFQWRIILRFVGQTWPKSAWKWIGGKWQWGSLLAAGLGMIKLGEYGVALFLFALAGFAASSKLAHWEHPNIRLGDEIIISGHILIIFAFVFLTIVAFSIKRKDPWSNVPFAVQRLMVLFARPLSQTISAALKRSWATYQIQLIVNWSLLSSTLLSRTRVSLQAAY